MTAPEIRRLTQDDYPAFERFLAGRAESSMFLRSNARAAGLDYAGKGFQARYFGAVDEAGLCGLLALSWGGHLMAQAPVDLLGPLLSALQAEEPEALATGLLAPADQAAWLLERLKPPAESVKLSEIEPLFRLALGRLVVPEPLRTGALVARRAGLEDLDFIVPWRVAYDIETMGGLRPEMEADARASIAAWIERLPIFLLEAEGRPIAMAAWNAELPDMVQIGGVFTPPELRSRGYGRAAVAAALTAARDRGATAAILFTHTPAAEQAYRALGFEQVGLYHIALFDPGVRLGDVSL